MMNVEDLNIDDRPIDETISVEISRDKMLGVISFTQPQNGGKLLSANQIKEAIAAKGIIEGIKEADVEELTRERRYDYKYVIAQGIQPQEGQDAQVKLNFNPEDLKIFKPKTNGDGTVDFKNLNIVHNVKKGEVLATKTLPTAGKDGVNVLGQVLKGKPGKDVRMPKGKNTELINDGLTLVASNDGKLEYDEDKVSVSTVYILNGDVGSGVGNIDFIGSVVINGNVGSGFTVKAQGSVEVRGVVEEATIIATGDIIISYGMQGGDQGRLKSGGNVIAKFIQNSVVDADKDVIAEAIMHSKVSAGGTIKVEMGKGLIVGGNCSATNLVTAKTIGSPMGTLTGIQIGVPPTMYQKYNQLAELVKQGQENVNKIDQSILFITSKAKNGALPPEKQAMLQKFREARGPLFEQLESDKKKYQYMSAKIAEANDGLIRVTGTVYSGTKVVYGSLIKYLDEDYARCTIRKLNGEIHIA